MKKNNHEFICVNCQQVVPPHPHSARNHCTQCLCSQHLDLNKPGDRACACHGLMKPVDIDYKSRKGYLIVHQCQKCGVKNLNRVAEDDNQEMVQLLLKDGCSVIL
jgi:hypothetical protein